MSKKLEGNLLAPKKVPGIPSTAQWLSGQGEGTWFSISNESNLQPYQVRIRRFSPQGNLDCDRIFNGKSSFDPSEEWQILHISHCAQVKVRQNQEIHIFEYDKDYPSNC